MYAQQLKSEIITSLDILPVESLEFLTKCVAFLKGQVTELLPSSTTASSVVVQSDNPLMQLGKNPIDDDITDASINHGSVPDDNPLLRVAGIFSGVPGDSAERAEEILAAEVNPIYGLGIR